MKILPQSIARKERQDCLTPMLHYYTLIHTQFNFTALDQQKILKRSQHWKKKWIYNNKCMLRALFCPRNEIFFTDNVRVLVAHSMSEYKAQLPMRIMRESLYYWFFKNLASVVTNYSCAKSFHLITPTLHCRNFFIKIKQESMKKYSPVGRLSEKCLPYN